MQKTNNAAMLATIQKVVQHYQAHPNAKAEVFVQMADEEREDVQQPLKSSDWIPAPNFLYIRVGEIPLPVVALGKCGCSQIMPMPIVVWEGKLREADSLPHDWHYVTTTQ